MADCYNNLYNYIHYYKYNMRYVMSKDQTKVDVLKYRYPILMHRIHQLI